MDKRGIWHLAPAYDITFSYKKDSIWVSAHQMLINGKADNITKEDLLKVAEVVGIKKTDARKCIDEVLQAVSKWELFAKEAELSEWNKKRIKEQLIC